MKRGPLASLIELARERAPAPREHDRFRRRTARCRAIAHRRPEDRARRASRAIAMPRTRASLHKTRTTASSRTCDRRPAQDRVGDPRCCSRWGCNSGPERKPACEAIVGGGRHPSLLSGVSDRQLPVDGAVRMPRSRSSGPAQPRDRFAQSERPHGCRVSRQTPAALHR